MATTTGTYNVRGGFNKLSTKQLTNHTKMVSTSSGVYVKQNSNEEGDLSLKLENLDNNYVTLNQSSTTQLKSPMIDSKLFKKTA